MSTELAPGSLVIVETTVANEAQARELAQRMVELRFAACAQIEPIASIYRWHDRIESEREYRIAFKTTGERCAQLEAELRARHPYELPQIHATTAAVAVEKRYADWVRDSVRAQAGSSGSESTDERA